MSEPQIAAEPPRWRIAIVATTGVAVTLGLTHLGAMNTVGAEWLWRVDHCPNSTTACGGLPVGVLGACLIGSLVAGVLARALTWGEA